MQKTNTKVEQNTNVEQAKYTRVESVEEARKVIARIDAGEEAVEKDGRGLLIWLLEDIGRAPALCEEYRSPTGLLVGPANKTRSTDANYTPAIRTFKRVYAYTAVASTIGACAPAAAYIVSKLQNGLAMREAFAIGRLLAKAKVTESNVAEKYLALTAPPEETEENLDTEETAKGTTAKGTTAKGTTAKGTTAKKDEPEVKPAVSTLDSIVVAALNDLVKALEKISVESALCVVSTAKDIARTKTTNM